MDGAAENPLEQENADIRATINAVHAFLLSEWMGGHTQHAKNALTKQPASNPHPHQDLSVVTQTQPAPTELPPQQSSDHDLMKSVQSMPTLSNHDSPARQRVLETNPFTQSEADQSIPRRTSSLTRSLPSGPYTPQRRRELSESSTDDDGRLRLNVSPAPVSLRRSTRGTSKALEGILTKID